jgi:hypothetical protein
MKRFFVVLLLTFALDSEAVSQDLGAMTAPASANLGSSSLTDQVVNDPTFRSDLEGSHRSGIPGSAAITFREVSATPTMAAKLAQAYPAAKRPEVEKLFSTLLTPLYPKVE